MKKVLALIVAFALCFTAFAGCFATSAAAPLSFTITGSIADENGAATVTVSGSYKIRTAQLLTVTLNENLKFEGVVDGININDVDNVTDETPENLYSVEGNVIKFLDDYTGNFEIVINVTAPANDGATDATYAVTASADIAGWDDTEVSSVDPVTAVVTVKAAVPEHTCTYGELQYKVEDGKCITYQECTDETCEEADKIVATITNSDITQSPCLNADLSVYFNILTSDVTGYTNLYATFEKEGFDNDADFDTVTKSVVETISGASYTRFYYGVDETTEAGNEIGITSKQMVNDIDCRIYGKKSDGVVVLVAQETWCMRDYIDEKYPQYSIKTTATYKKLTTLLVDLANYGAQAQKTFKYNVNDLANANIDNKTYATPIRDDFVDTDSWDGVELKTGGDLASKVLLLVNIPKSAVVNENYKLKINYINADKQADVKTYNFSDFAVYNNSYYRVKFDGYVAPSLLQPATITLYDDEDQYVGSIPFSFASYAGRLKGYAASNAAVYAPSYAAVQYLYAYGTSAAAYFNFNV